MIITRGIGGDHQLLSSRGFGGGEIIEVPLPEIYFVPQQNTVATVFARTSSFMPDKRDRVFAIAEEEDSEIGTQKFEPFKKPRTFIPH